MGLMHPYMLQARPFAIKPRIIAERSSRATHGIDGGRSTAKWAVVGGDGVCVCVLLVVVVAMMAVAVVARAVAACVCAFVRARSPTHPVCGVMGALTGYTSIGGEVGGGGGGVGAAVVAAAAVVVCGGSGCGLYWCMRCWWWLGGVNMGFGMGRGWVDDAFVPHSSDHTSTQANHPPFSRPGKLLSWQW